MRVLLSWLAELTPLEISPTDRSAVAALSADLDSLGLVVEGVERVGGGLGDVVVARVLEIAAIPKADRIRRVVVDAGGPDPFEVVCGAWNFSTGDLVAFAPVGSELPGGLRIEQRTLRGVTSNGMLCSGRELELSEDHEGILVLGSGAGSSSEPEPGRPLVEQLGIEVEVVFDLAIEGNRPDCLSMIGIARDLAAKRGLPLFTPRGEIDEGAEQAARLGTVEVLAPDLCSRLAARVITDVRVVASPPAVARRLVLSGMRPINAVVDASNYVMLELGQPTHPYDLERLGGRGLRVRVAAPGEELVTLDGVTRVLGTRPPRDGDPTSGLDLLICDAEDHPVGIAGVMGGRSSEISDDSSQVLLEVAAFTPVAIGRTARWLGLRTEASVRFERGVDPGAIELSAERFCTLVSRAAATAETSPPIVARGMLDANPVPFERTRVVVRPERVSAVLGMDVDARQLVDLLAPLGMVEARGPVGSVAPAGGERASVVEIEVPSFRPDVRVEADVIEEVARRIGYQAIPRTKRRSPQVGRLSDLQQLRRKVRRVLCGLGASEAWTMSLVDEDDQRRGGVDVALVRVTNPMAVEAAVLRGGLLPGLLAALARNVDHRHPHLRLFEIGDVFACWSEGARPSSNTSRPGPESGNEKADAKARLEGLPDERERIGLLLALEEDDARSAVASWRTLEDQLRLAPLELRSAPVPGLHPARSAALLSGTGWRPEAQGTVIGWVGEVDPQVVEAFGLGARRVGWLELDAVALCEAPRMVLEASAVSRFPSADIDLAFVVGDAVPAGRVRHVLEGAAGPECESVALFDVYRGPAVEHGARGLAYRLRFCALDRTLTEAELADHRGRCIDKVEATLEARLRA